MYKNNDKVTDGKEQSSSFIEPVYKQIHYSTKKLCLQKGVSIAVDEGLESTTDSSCALVQLNNIETIVVQKSKRSSLIKNVT